MALPGYDFTEEQINAMNKSYETSINLLQNWFNPMQTEIDFNAYQAQLDRDFSSEQARLQREFELEMSNTAYQRTVEDMRKAGLNPYAVYGNSSGFDVASTPQGAVAQGSRASIGSHQNGLFGIVNTALSIAKISLLKNSLAVPVRNKVGFI